MYVTETFQQRPSFPPREASAGWSAPERSRKEVLPALEQLAQERLRAAGLKRGLGGL